MSLEHYRLKSNTFDEKPRRMTWFERIALGSGVFFVVCLMITCVLLIRSLALADRPDTEKIRTLELRNADLEKRNDLLESVVRELCAPRKE